MHGFRSRLALALAICGLILLWEGGSTLYFWARPATAPVGAPLQLQKELRNGTYLGRLIIPRLKMSDAILSGIDDAVLMRGLGHVPGTPMPGQEGNVAIAGHRDTHFRGLRNIRRGDEILVESGTVSKIYRVTETRIVEPSDVNVLRRGPEPSLTLITCYPFYFIGPAPQRFIVKAVMLAS